MKFQINRLAALVSMLVLICFMVVFMAFPAFAAEIGDSIHLYVGSYSDLEIAAAILEASGADLVGFADYFELASCLSFGKDVLAILFDSSQSVFFVSEVTVAYVQEVYDSDFDDIVAISGVPISSDYYCDDSEMVFYQLDISISYPITRLDSMSLHYAGSVSEETPPEESISGSSDVDSVLVSSVDSDSMSYVLNEILDILPVVLAVIIGFIALRKGIQFISGLIHSA